jgi:hypothetical protein
MKKYAEIREIQKKRRKKGCPLCAHFETEEKRNEALKERPILVDRLPRWRQALPAVDRRDNLRRRKSMDGAD